MKQKLTRLCLALMATLFLVSSTPVFAAEEEEIITEPPVSTTSEGSEIGPMAIQYEWKFRVYMGINQKRLWNCTEAEWVGEWDPPYIPGKG